MVTKFIIRGFSKKFKGVQKLKPQKSYKVFDETKARVGSEMDIRTKLGGDDFPNWSPKAIQTLRGESVALKLANRKFFRTFGKELKGSRKKTATFIKGASSNIKGNIRPKKVIPKFTVPKTQYQVLEPAYISKKGEPVKEKLKFFRSPLRAGETIIGKSRIRTSKPLRIAKQKGAKKSYKSADLAANKIYTKTMKRFADKESVSPFKTFTKKIPKKYSTAKHDSRELRHYKKVRKDWGF